MGADSFARIAQEVSPYTEELALHLLGEPLGHTALKEILDHCEKAKLKVNLSTNGVLLKNPEKYALLFHPCLRQINFSLHSFDSNFEVDKLSAYLEAIFRFTEEVAEKKLDLFINYRLWNFQSTDTKSAANKNLVPKTNALILSAIEERFQKKINPELDLRQRKGFRIQDKVFLHFDTQFEWPSLKNPFRSKTGFCYGLESHIGILADGTVVPCCLDYAGEISLGNIFKNSLEEILLSEKAQNMVAGFKKRELREELCQKCSFISRFDARKAL